MNKCPECGRFISWEDVFYVKQYGLCPKCHEEAEESFRELKIA